MKQKILELIKKIKPSQSEVNLGLFKFSWDQKKKNVRKGNIKAGKNIKAGGSILASGDIEAGGSIDVGTNIRAGKNE